MPVLFQIGLGTLILLICAILHLAITTGLIQRLKQNQPSFHQRTRSGNFLRTAVVFIVFLASHTLHLYIWAFAIWALDALDGYEEPIYFALVTYTTVGYGDVTLAPDFRIFGAMASVTGILLFGVTTAFLVSYLAQLMERNETDR